MLTIDQMAQSIELAGVGYRTGLERPANTIAGCLARAPVRCLGPHEQLFRDGDEKTNVYQIVEGAFVLYRLLPNGRRQVTGFAVADDLIGLGAGKTHRCTAESSRASRVRPLPAAALHRLANEDSNLGMRLYDALSQELMTAQDQLMTVGRLNAAERVATFLLGLSERQGSANRVELPMTRCDIADFLGLTTETVSRTLTKLANSNVITRHQGHIRILDSLALEDIADGSQVI